MPGILKDQRGILPLFLLIAIGVVVVAGGVYVVREQFVKTGQSGKSTYDTQKIKEQVKNPGSFPSLSPEPKVEQTYGKPVTYTPEENSSNEPSFTITPPAGWEKTSGGATGTKVQFRHPTQDKEEMEDGLYAKANAQISVVISQTNSTLDQIISVVKSSATKNYENAIFVTERKLTYAKQEAILLETKLFKKGVAIHSIDYYFIKDGFLVHTVGTSLDSTWNQRYSAIQSSLDSFKLAN